MRVALGSIRPLWGPGVRGDPGLLAGPGAPRVTQVPGAGAGHGAAARSGLGPQTASLSQRREYGVRSWAVSIGRDYRDQEKAIDGEGERQTETDGEMNREK